MPTTYNIIIDHNQLQLITAGLSQLISINPEHPILLEMLKDLPSQEKESPRTTHGLCL